MNNAISLVESRTFWAAVLALVAIVAKQFGLSGLLAAALSPATTDMILQGASIAGVVLTMVFRTAATSKVVAVLPSGVPTVARAIAWLAVLPVGAKVLFVVCVVMGLAACSQAQLTNALTAGAAAAPAACAAIYGANTSKDALCLTSAGAAITVGDAYAAGLTK